MPNAVDILRARKEYVNPDRVFQIESNWNPQAVNKQSGARGLGQIMPIALEDYNQLNPQDKYSWEQMFDPQLNAKVSTWMLQERIPQMLEHYKLPVTVDNILWAYNAGIGNVRKNRLPSETKKYIQRYKEVPESSLPREVTL